MRKPVARSDEPPAANAALICVAAEHVVGVAQGLLQRELPIECAVLHGDGRRR